MEQTIVRKLREIEKNEHVRILLAVESGSRAWGFPSTDSDYDVRFIYIRQKEYYLRLEKTRDVIELPLDDVLDINGWDLQKTLRLMLEKRFSFPSICGMVLSLQWEKAIQNGMILRPMEQGVSCPEQKQEKL